MRRLSRELPNRSALLLSVALVACASPKLELANVRPAAAAGVQIKPRLKPDADGEECRRALVERLEAVESAEDHRKLDSIYVDWLERYESHDFPIEKLVRGTDGFVDWSLGYDTYFRDIPGCVETLSTFPSKHEGHSPLSIRVVRKLRSPQSVGLELQVSGEWRYLIDAKALEHGVELSLPGSRPVVSFEWSVRRSDGVLASTGLELPRPAGKPGALRQLTLYAAARDLNGDELRYNAQLPQIMELYQWGRQCKWTPQPIQGPLLDFDYEFRDGAQVTRTPGRPKPLQLADFTAALERGSCMPVAR